MSKFHTKNLYTILQQGKITRKFSTDPLLLFPDVNVKKVSYFLSM